MLIGLTWYLNSSAGWAATADPDRPELLAKPVVAGLNRLHLTWLGALMAGPLAAGAIYQPQIGRAAIAAVVVAVVTVLIYFVVKLQGAARYRLLALMWLMGFHMLFWAGFEQAGSSFSILTDRHVDRDVLG